MQMFSFRMCQDTVRRETTEGSSIEFIRYRIPQYKQIGCTVLLLIKIFTSKVGVAKNMPDVFHKWTPQENIKIKY